MDRISIRHPASYAEGSQIGEETKIAVDYLRYLSAHFKQMAALIRILPEDVSDLGIGVAPVDVFYSLETPELSEALGDVRRSARALREVLENREPKSRPDTELEGQSSSGLWLDYLYILDEVLPADDGLLERFRWLPIITDQADSDVLALFINVAGTKDVVARDQHGVG